MKVSPVFRTIWYKRTRSSDAEKNKAKREVELFYNLSGSIEKSVPKGDKK